MKDKAIAAILEHADAGAELRKTFFEREAEAIRKAAFNFAVSIARGHKILFCGNGGSAADAQHLAAEFVNRFIMDRPPLPAIALTTDTSIITAVGNDRGFEQAFSCQVHALGNAGDILCAFSTSGNSPNILLALEAARERSMTTVGLTGGSGGKMAGLCDMLFKVDSDRTPLIQETHITLGHLLCGLTDYYLFENVAAIAPYIGTDIQAPR